MPDPSKLPAGDVHPNPPHALPPPADDAAAEGETDAAALLLAQLERMKQAKYKPTLVLAPSSAAGVWKTEFAANFPGMRLMLWLGSDEASGPSKRTQILPSSISHFRSWLAGLDSNDPLTGRICILTSYTTLVSRAFHPTEEGHRVAAQRLTTQARSAEGHLEDDLEAGGIDDSALKYWVKN